MGPYDTERLQDTHHFQMQLFGSLAYLLLRGDSVMDIEFPACPHCYPDTHQSMPSIAMRFEWNPSQNIIPLSGALWIHGQGQWHRIRHDDDLDPFISDYIYLGLLAYATQDQDCVTLQWPSEDRSTRHQYSFAFQTHEPEPINHPTGSETVVPVESLVFFRKEPT